MYWTLELASKLEDAPWPATKEELLDYANRIGAPAEVIENLQELEDEDDEQYESILDICYKKMVRAQLSGITDRYRYPFTFVTFFIKRSQTIEFNDGDFHILQVFYHLEYDGSFS